MRKGAPSLDNLIKPFSEMTDEEIDEHLRSIRDARKRNSIPPPKKERGPKKEKVKQKEAVDFMTKEELQALLED